MIEVRLEGDDRNQHQGLRSGLVVRRATSLGYGAPRKIDPQALPVGAMLDVRVGRENGLGTTTASNEGVRCCDEDRFSFAVGRRFYFETPPCFFRHEGATS